jgi:hypothetical protein
MRLYAPKRKVLTGKWNPPPVAKASEDSGCRLGRPLLEAIARESISLVQKFEAAREIPSYEKLLIEKAGYGRLMARLMAYQICHCVKNHAAEINEGRRVRAIID